MDENIRMSRTSESIEQNIRDLEKEIIVFKSSVLKKNNVIASKENIELIYYDFASHDDHIYVNGINGRIAALLETRLALIQHCPVNVVETSPSKSPPVLASPDVLDELFHILEGEKYICFASMSEVPPTAKVIECGGMLFPESVDACVDSSFDLRLPHSNPLLSEDSPLYEMRDDIIRSLEESHMISYPVILGSSGVGKTTAAFLVAEKRWTVFIEMSNFVVQPRFGYRCGVKNLLKKSSSHSDATFDDVVRRCQREILARALILAQLKRKYPDITPYEGLLFQLSPAMQDCYLVVLNALGNGYDENENFRLFNCINLFLFGERCDKSGKSSLGLIVDEAHLMNDEKWLEFEGNSLNTYQVFLYGMSLLPLAGVISVGTQVGLENAARHVSAVAKLMSTSYAYVFGKYPVLGGYGSTGEWTVGRSLGRCIVGYTDASEDTRRMIENDLSGRPRFCATFLMCYLKITSISGECRSLDHRLTAAWREFDQLYSNKGTSFAVYAELARLLKYEVVRQHHNYDNILNCLVMVLQNEEQPSTLVTPLMGTVICTRRVHFSNRDYKTGFRLPLGVDSCDILFDYVLDEPRLKEDLWRILTDSRNWSLANVKRNLLKTLQTKFLNSNSQSRGIDLDEYVLFKIMVDTIKTPKSLNTLFNPRGNEHVAQWLNGAEEATVCLRKVVKGVGKLSAWAEALQDGSLNFYCGEKAVHVAVLPEPNAGADGMFAASCSNGTIIIISIACAWYEKGVPMAKVEQQLRTGNPLTQFVNGATARSEDLKERRDRLNRAFTLSNWDSRIVMIELPHRRGVPPKNNIDGNCLVVDDRTIEDILGFSRGYFSTSETEGSEAESAPEEESMMLSGRVRGRSVTESNCSPSGVQKVL